MLAVLMVVQIAPLFMVLVSLYEEMNPRVLADIIPIRKRIPLANMLDGMCKAYPETEPHVGHSLPSLCILYL